MIFNIVKKNNLILWDFLYWSLIIILFVLSLFLLSFKNGIVLSSALIVSCIILFYSISNKNILLFLIFFFLATSIRTPVSISQYQFSISELFLYLLFLISLPKLSENSLYSSVLKNKPIKMYIIYSITMTIALIIDDYGTLRSNLNAFRIMILPIILYIVLLAEFNYKNIKKIIITLISIAIIMGVIGIMQSIFGKMNILQSELQRDYFSMILGNKIGFAKPATGLFEHWNSMALYIQIYLVIALAFSMKLKNNLYKRISVVLFLYFLFIELLTLSRGGYISSLLGITILLWVNSKRTKVLSIIILSLLLVAIFVYIIPSFKEYIAQFQSMFYRFNLWYKGLHYLSLHPTKIFFGTGWESYPVIARDVFTAHNIYLLHLVEMGIFSLITFLVFIYYLLKYFYDSYINADNDLLSALSLGLFAGYFGYFIHEFIEHSFANLIFRNQLMIWLVVLFILNKKIGHEKNNKKLGNI